MKTFVFFFFFANEKNCLLLVPSMAPQNIRAEAKSKTELLIMWEPPPSEACNGILIGYHVKYQLIGAMESAGSLAAQQNHDIIKTININSQYGEDVVINDLTPYTMYSIVVQAFNSKGSGPFSKPITVQTDEGGNNSLTWVGFQIKAKIRFEKKNQF